jgi:hypothetical protein
MAYRKIETKFDNDSAGKHSMEPSTHGTTKGPLRAGKRVPKIIKAFGGKASSGSEGFGEEGGGEGSGDGG